MIKRVSICLTLCLSLWLFSLPAILAQGGETPQPDGSGGEKVEKSGTGFPDVPESHWAADKIKALAERNCIHGYTDGTFRPEQQVSRAELAALLVNAAGENENDPDKPSFSDVDRNQWFYSIVKTAKKYFATDPSVGQGLFRPGDLVTREEAAAALVLAKNLKAGEAEQPYLQKDFTDYDNITPEYRNSIALAVRNNLVSGYADGSFRPQSPMTRAEAASLVYNAFFTEKAAVTIDGLLKSGEIKPFDESADEFSTAVETLISQFGQWEGVGFSFYIKEIPVNGNQGDRLILVFARVDPFKYFTFSDAVFKPAPGKTREFAERISAAVSGMYPARRNLVVIGFTDLTFYNTTPEIYGREYTTYSPAEEGWRVERFYAGAMSLDGKITETWLEPQKS
ncbi:MAG: S-layer homology domain-containing protein [Peptococcaceae bacterium]|nr:S-layer homology domain-containing protein [Peptococcaceae bacterium]